VNDPNRPNTNPAMAMAAMSVIAMRMTVASTGEIAFLCLLGILKLVPFYDQTPENATVAPLLRVTDPTACEPTVCEAVAASWRQTKLAVLLAPTVGRTSAPLHATAVPPIWTLPPVTTTLEVPVLVRVIVHTLLSTWVPGAPPPPAALYARHEVTCPETCAELVNDPNRPNTNPAMAMAAMSVIAMRMTVASTGEMAFLFFL